MLFLKHMVFTIPTCGRNVLTRHLVCNKSVIYHVERNVSSSVTSVDLSGIFPPIPTPFNEDESIAYDKLEVNFKQWDKVPFQGYVVQGSNGEYPFLSNSERIEMVKFVRQLIPSNKLLIAGSSSESTRMTIELTNEMASVGANAVMVINPSYFKSNMTNPALIKHYEDLADNSCVPVIIYNMPANTGIDLNVDLLTKLSQHPNIIGMKDSGGDITKIARVVARTKNNNFQVVAGSTGFLLPALLVGCVGGINGLANILGDEVCNIYKLFKESKLQEAVTLHQKLVEPNAKVTRELGVPAMKAAMDFMGLYGGPCRRPLMPLTEVELKSVIQAFTSNGFQPKL
ncbi:hypothetical protein L9F63_019463 [Diploptera punctata]|uniref:4-hydroxy-2-oxoglutarate aldolase, mitochondrial n=1 Tax=Diploptera punctata TaxID=6984 RepID=A0AAD7ZUK4_DIPPU|nr:hypothetical protein L9F63_019463 [Diploptera punctata]